MGNEAQLVPIRLARGSRCFGAWVGHELVGYGWLSSKSEWIGELELEIALGPGEAYIWNCVTLAPHRRKGVFRSVVSSLVAQAREEGMARLWIASIVGVGGNAIQDAGFQPVLRFDSATRLGLRWLMVKPVQGVNSDLAASAREALAVKTGLSMRRSKSRRH
jgi:GNAT superfamily N-acetyltransferase